MEVKVIRKKQTQDAKEDVNNKINVAAYVRVSTLEEEQQKSFISQQKYFISKIRNRADWNFVNVFTDEGISGGQINKRANFMRMIREAMLGKIDLILTKSISRFARNTLDTLKYVRMLKEKNIAVYFEEENINTLDMNGELLLTILSSIAQQEITNISEHCKLGARMKMKRGEAYGVHSCYGYNYNQSNKEIIINEYQAKVINKIFELYLNGNSINTICKILKDENIKTFRGKDHWQWCTVKGILENPKYTGDILLGKFYREQSVNHRIKKNDGRYDMYFVRNHHESIITKEDFEKTKSIIGSRKKYSEDFNKLYVFSGIIKCGFCGNCSKRKQTNKKTKPKYLCSRARYHVEDKCTFSKEISEEILKNTFMEALCKFKKIVNHRFNNHINFKLKYIREILSNESSNMIEFDEELFRKTVKYILVGKKYDDEKIDPYLIRFILKEEMDLYSVDTIFKKSIDISKEFYTVFEYSSKQKYQTFVKDENNIHRIDMDKINVTLEFDISEVSLWK